MNETTLTDKKCNCGNHITIKGFWYPEERKTIVRMEATDSAFMVGDAGLQCGCGRKFRTVNRYKWHAQKTHPDRR